MDSLIKPLFDDPIDIVGDVHGEIDALRDLLCVLGHSVEKPHSAGRRLAFVGDLTDRGPDSPTVVELVRQLVDAGQAQCVLGSHELNLLLGDRKHDNHWFFGEPWSLAGKEHPPTPAVLAIDAVRARVLAFFGMLPLALERDDVRVVHLCWEDEMTEGARQSSDVITLCERFRDRIEAEHRAGSDLDEIDRELDHQNRNPVKVLTSGKERRVAVPFEAGGKLRYAGRVNWWEDDAADEPLCVFGHYAEPTGSSCRRGRRCASTSGSHTTIDAVARVASLTRAYLLFR